MKNIEQQSPDLRARWASLPGELRGGILTILLLVGLIAITGLAVGLENLFAGFWSTLTAPVLMRGGLLILVTLFLSVVWLVIGARFAMRRAYNDAIGDVKKSFGDEVNNLKIAVGEIAANDTRRLNESRVQLNNVIGEVKWSFGEEVTKLNEVIREIKRSFEGEMQELKKIASEQLPASTTQLSTFNAETKETFNEWRKTADGVLSAAAITSLQNTWLTHPWEYIKFIEEADDRHYKLGEVKNHIGSITLYGTMVGFSFLLPEALRNHACRAQGEFNFLKVIASDAETKIGEATTNLVHYPLWLAAQLTQELFLNCKKFLTTLEGGHEFRIEICYLPHDLMSAAIHLPPEEIAVLQALDSTTFNRVLDGRELQRGFRYQNTATQHDAYDRYVAVLKSVATQFRGGYDGNAATNRKSEIWSFGRHDSVHTLTITNPHWKWENGNVAKILGQAEYDDLVENTVRFASDPISVEQFAAKLLSKLRVSGSTGVHLRTLETTVAEKKKLWERRHQLGCPCSS